MGLFGWFSERSARKQVQIEKKHKEDESQKLMSVLFDFAYSKGGSEIAQRNKEGLRKLIEEELIEEMKEQRK